MRTEMTGLAAVVVWLLSPMSAHTVERADRFLIALEYRGPSVAFAEHPFRCGMDRASRDILWGVVQGDEGKSEGEAAVYEGVLQRLTEQTLCGASVQGARARRTAVPAQPCRAGLSGAGDVKIRIKIYQESAELQGAWIVITPIDVMARVTGDCRSGEMREMQRAYGERTTFEIQTPPDRLVPGRYAADRVAGAMGRWVLTVAPWTPVVPSS